MDTTIRSPSLRPELESLPARMGHLPIARGYPVPWFVAWVNGEPEFRAADSSKWADAVKHRLCWVCGCTLDRRMTFVAGPMCGINRTSAEPPCHLECAQWSARNYPFLSRPHASRRDSDGLDGKPFGGFSIQRNPGVTMLWTTRQYSVFPDGMGGKLIQMGEPEAVEWWAEGKIASRSQVEASIEAGLPSLMSIAEAEGPEAIEYLDQARRRFELYLPR